MPTMHRTAIRAPELGTPTPVVATTAPRVRHVRFTGNRGALARLMSAMRVLGLDLGERRIGLALSDSEGEFAFPAGVLESRGRDRDVAALCELIREREVGRAVVGLPRHMDGRLGPEAEAAEQFASLLAKRAGIPVETLDERWTSQEAERILREQGHDGRRTKKHVDEVAASIILRTHLELKRTQRATAEAAGAPERD